MIGFGAFVWICRVLLNRNYKSNVKLGLIHLRTVMWCFIFLFIVRCLVLGMILLDNFPTLRFCCVLVFCIYLFLSSSNSIDNFIKHDEIWDRENKLTLLDIKKKYCHENNKS